MWVFSGAILPLIIMLPSTPDHDGVRMFRPAFFFVAILAGFGYELLRRRWLEMAVATIVFLKNYLKL